MQKLPQVTAPYLFVVKNLEDLGIKQTPITIKAGKLKPMQSTLQLKKVETLANAFKEGEDVEPIYISKDLHIGDGHHRAAGKIENEGKEGKIYAIMLDCTKEELPHVLGRVQDRWELVQDKEEEFQDFNSKYAEKYGDKLKKLDKFEDDKLLLDIEEEKLAELAMIEMEDDEIEYEFNRHFPEKLTIPGLNYV